MNGPTRHLAVGISADSLMHQWARQEAGPDGSALIVDREIAARTRGGVQWQSEDALAIAVLARPESLAPTQCDASWLVAGLGAVRALEVRTGSEHQCLWPDSIASGIGHGAISTSVSSQLGPGRTDYLVLTVRIQGAGSLGDKEQTAAEFIDQIRSASTLFDDPVELTRQYRTHCATIGASVVATLLPRGTIRGIARDVESNGSLVVESPTELRESVAVATLRSIDITSTDLAGP